MRFYENFRIRVRTFLGDLVHLVCLHVLMYTMECTNSQRDREI